ncbi:MAG: indolepyruvate oxidoreductase subunit beta, partial [Proteobacteria bacterium]|nr:indolepyruvate oxidoreductase subunit beta [Pseudomonadota bacterium]
MKLKDPFNMVICGTGGQGNVLLARLLGQIFATKGYKVIVGETFGAAQRGGSVFSGLRLSRVRTYGPLIPKWRAQVVIGLEPLESLRMLSRFGNSEVVTITNTLPVYPLTVGGGNQGYPDLGQVEKAIRTLSLRVWFVPATDIAVQLGSPIMTNMVMLGALLGSKVLPLEFQDVEQGVAKTGNTAQVGANLRAVQEGYRFVTQ